MTTTTAPQAPTTPRRVAVVLAGAGARGCYEAGAMAVVLPRLAAAGVVPSLYVGTSAGAINATLLAASAHLPADRQADLALELWGRMRTRDVFRSPVRSGGGTLVRWTGQVLHVPGARVTGLLDTAPLMELAERSLDWDQLHRNLDDADGDLTLAVVATSGTDNRTVVFVAGAGADRLPPSDDERPIDYRAARIGAAHVIASASIPVAFPPTWVPEDAGQVEGAADAGADGQADGDWYLDGGVRLNAPLKPAIALGADAVVVVATHPVVDRVTEVPHTGPGEPPDVDDTVVRVMDAALVDRMVEDVHALARTNVLVDAAAGRADGPATTYRRIPFLAVCPRERGTLAHVASEVFGRRAGVVADTRRFLRDPTMRVLGHALDGDGDRRGDLMSYLYFDPEFAAAAMERGREDAAALLAGTPEDAVPWQLGLDGATDAGL
ncbi:patatin-like phospholipase family protein [Nocardioides sp. YIM 152588]|uniref:patatin-like phospholipase family protein n=1 Tax=Nocardioides sp. YIM 152588 TaxID=3158259 RepID=UPI0032E52786